MVCGLLTHRSSILAQIARGFETAVAFVHKPSLHRAVPRSIPVIIVADRGFGQMELFRFLDGLGWSCVIRVKGDAYLDNGGTIENAQALAAHESPRTIN